jgi:hypothetical protein
MEQDVLDVLASLKERSPKFREQVERMRAFKERMKEAGVEVRANKFSISLTEGRALVATNLKPKNKTDNNA